jgi:hypothetical protein
VVGDFRHGLAYIRYVDSLRHVCMVVLVTDIKLFSATLSSTCSTEVLPMCLDFGTWFYTRESAF